MALRVPTDEALAAAYSKLDPQSGWRHVAMVSASTRRFALRQIVRVQLAYVLGVLLIFTAQLTQPTSSRRMLWVWLIASGLNLALRMAMLRLFATRDPNVAATSRFWRLVPLSNILVVGLHWVWTSALFLDPAWGFSTFTIVLVYLMMSVAAMNYAPASVVPAAAYLGFLWIPVVLTLWPDWVGDPGTFAVAFVAVLAVVCTSMYFTQDQLRRYLAAADEVDHLVTELRQRNAELQRLRQRADAELHERSLFFATASHDFGQRLHALKLLASTVQSDTNTCSAPVGRRLGSAVAELDHYVHHILDFARLQSGVQQPRGEVFNLQDLFQQIAVNFEHAAAQRNVDLRVRTCDIVLRTDPGMLLRILENLVANAIKFSRKGVLLAARRAVGGIRIEVWDQGPGIPPHALPQIFRPFHQERDPSIAASAGVGLGLASAKGLAALLGMLVGVRSRPGHGSVFAVVVDRDGICSNEN